MKLRNIAFKNILRRKSRALLVMTGIIAGVGSVVAVVSYTSAMTDQINHRMEKFGANIIVTPKTDELDLSYGGMSAGGISLGYREIDSSALEKIKHIKYSANIAATGPVLLGPVKIAGRDVLAAGINFGTIKILKPWWKVDGAYPEKDGIIAGHKAAAVLGLKPGGTLVISGRLMKVAGVLGETGSQDDSILFMKLETAQSILGRKGVISMIEVAALCNACPVSEMVEQISGQLPDAKVTALQQVVAGRLNTLGEIKRLSLALSGIIMAIGTLVVFVTMMGNVRERRSEIGILRAIGYRRIHVVSIILMETGILSVFGGIAGYAAGFTAARILALLSAGSEPLMIHSGPAGIGLAILLALAAGTVAGIYPALTASNLDPAEALRSI